jgi:hypothetical protein
VITLPKQNNYQVALEKAWDALRTRPGSELQQLGAQPQDGDRWALPVLNARFEFDFERRAVEVAGAGPASAWWSILSLHNLLAPAPVAPVTRWISFEEMPAARAYSGPYRGRVIRPFCSTVGRSREALLAAAAALGAEEISAGDAAVQLPVFPSVPLRIVWYAGDDELPPDATFLYGDNVSALLDVEDIVVCAERLVSRLRGKPW